MTKQSVTNKIVGRWQRWRPTWARLRLIHTTRLLRVRSTVSRRPARPWPRSSTSITTKFRRFAARKTTLSKSSRRRLTRSDRPSLRTSAGKYSHIWDWSSMVIGADLRRRWKGTIRRRRERTKRPRRPLPSSRLRRPTCTSICLIWNAARLSLS